MCRGKAAAGRAAAAGAESGRRSACCRCAFEFGLAFEIWGGVREGQVRRGEVEEEGREAAAGAASGGRCAFYRCVFELKFPLKS